MENKKKLPVTVLCGFLGAGKTTLLNYILKQRHDYRIAVIVNDMGEINVDSDLIRQGNFSIKKTKEKLVEMHNGCICCTLREDLIKQVTRIAKSGKFDYLIIESSGISEPLPIAQAFYFENEEMKKKKMVLKKYSRLDTMVTVVDALNFLDQLQSDKMSEESTAAKGEGKPTGPADGQIPLSQLLLDQVEFANVIILNKVDMIDAERKTLILSLLKKVNPTAKVLESVKSVIDLKEIINTRLFNFEAAQTTGKWIAELQKPQHNSEILEYGIQSCAFRSRVPFHPYRLFDLIQQNHLKPENTFWNHVIRAKGYMWIASKPLLNVHIHKAGTQLTYEPGAFWWWAIPKKNWAETQEEIDVVWDVVKENWQDNSVGDRRQEIIFIGQNLPKQEIFEAFTKCQLTEQEMGIDWDPEDDPFPKEWNKLIKDFQNLGEIREQDGEWEDIWDESVEMQEEDNDDEIYQE